MAEQDVKNAFEMAFQQSYDNMIGLINKMGVSQRLKDYAFLNFDQGYFWTRQAIASLVVDEPVSDPNGEAPIIIDGVDSQPLAE